MKRLFGNTGGLKANHVQRLEKLYRRRTPPEFIITPELSREISNLSFEIRRQIGLLINRLGKVAYVIIGDHQGIVIPDISDYRIAAGRLRGLRCIHTHLKNESLTRDDLTDLALLRLDLMAAVTISKDGLPFQVHAAHILPASSDVDPYQIMPPLNPNQLNIGCLELIQAIEAELDHVGPLYAADTHAERALLVSVTTASRRSSEESLAELEELAASSGIEVLESVLQQRSQVDSRFLMGIGKLKDITILALQKGATLIVFDQELNPAQIRSITDMTDLKVIDRTQLILDIFAQRAITREGKLQVELAQLKYLLPRLITKNTAMSRLTGGIGGRGPGETKLEINRRRVHDRIAQLEKDLVLVKKQRKQQKAKRDKRGLPIISIIGYTNAGKSTLLNTLTKSNVRAEKRLFATLDPSSRRLKFPKDMEVIITDTVGFIKDLPQDLMVAFRATLEELESADLLLHVIDISNPRFEDQIKSVEKILIDLNLYRIPAIRVLNKRDLVPKNTAEKLCRQLNGISISANDESTLMPLIEMMEDLIAKLNNSVDI
ncbi:MAG: GTPase HflX [Desulfobacterales bacterium]|nr:GTPase HflX [Desulfobacterales bacterium]